MKYDLTRQNYWTGLRVPTDNVNWMVYYCLIRKMNYTTPMDCIMYLINEYLNWMPALCWNLTEFNSCATCRCGHWCGDLSTIPVGYCSFQCLEIKRRNDIISESTYFIHVMDLFNEKPIEAIESGSIYLDNIDDYMSIETFQMIENGFDIYSECYSESDYIYI